MHFARTSIHGACCSFGPEPVGIVVDEQTRVARRKQETSLFGIHREELEALIERIVEHLDMIDGDPDFEPCGDEFDSSNAEDDFRSLDDDHSTVGAGCTISDGGI